MKPEELLPDYSEITASTLMATLEPRLVRDFWPLVSRFFDQPQGQVSIDIQELNKLFEDKMYMKNAVRYAGAIIAGDSQVLRDWDQDFPDLSYAKERAQRFAIGISQLFGNIMLGMQMGAEASSISPFQAERLEQRLASDLSRMLGAGGKTFPEQQRLCHVLTIDWLTPHRKFMARYLGSLSDAGGTAYPTLTSKLPDAIQRVYTSDAKLARHQSGTRTLELVQGDLPLGKDVEAFMTTMGRMTRFKNELRFLLEGETEPRRVEISVPDAVEFYYGDYGKQQFSLHPLTGKPVAPLYELTEGGRTTTVTVAELRKKKWNDEKILTSAAIRPLLDFDPLKPETSPMASVNEPEVWCMRPGERLAVMNSTDADEWGSREFRNFLMKRAGVDPDHLEKLVEIDELSTTGERLNLQNPRVSGITDGSGNPDRKSQGALLAAEALSVREYHFRKIALGLHVVLGSGVSFDPGYRGENAYDPLVKALRFDAYMHRYDLAYDCLRTLATGAYDYLPSDKEAYIPEWAAVTGKIPKDWRLHHRNPLSPEDNPILRTIRGLSGEELLKDAKEVWAIVEARAIVLDVLFAHRPMRTDIETEQLWMNEIVLAAQNGWNGEKLMGVAQERRVERVKAIMKGGMSDVMNIRSRQQMWAMVEQLPEDARKKLMTADFKDYLESMGYPQMNLDSVEYKGIRGLEKLIHMHDWRSIRWGQKDNLVIKWWKYKDNHADHIQKIIEIGSAVIQAIDPVLLRHLGPDPEFIKAAAAGKNLEDFLKTIGERQIDEVMESVFRTNKIVREYVEQVVKGTLEASDISFVGPMGQRAVMLDLTLYIFRLMNGYVAPIVFEGMARGAAGHEADTTGEHGSKAKFLEVPRKAFYFKPLREALLAAGDYLVDNGLHNPYITTGDGIAARLGARDASGKRMLAGVVHPLVPYGHRGDLSEAAIKYVVNRLEDAGILVGEDTQRFEGILKNELAFRKQALQQAGASGQEAQYKYLIPV